jgi:NADH dehydrogenase FAD-containing subunit
VKESKNIVIIGGGPIGIEMAGEIVDEYDDKNIHIIHSRDTLCDPALSAKFHKNLLDAVKKKGINVVLGERVNLDEIDVSNVR